ncbi:phytanoyl-CoA dioxygenase family protein [Pelagibius sp. Alg239-R121]|uniref:phytanoyl-CoA dioxygenase family protein n=1 Tax=Pelagibius sp. Alg239-R121 TaxID=2993448 RepID=UPI0024A719DD|nr:phytanoyl-CoA dioxygenase family protein [Pelagibius sp. Alg239-R121]
MRDTVALETKGISGEVASFFISDAGQGDDAVAAYRQDGVVCLRNVVSADWLGVIEEGIEAALSGASTDFDVVKIDGNEGRFSFSSQAWKQVEPFRRFIFDSPLPDLCWPFLESDTLTLFYDFLLVKEARSSGAATPWHQDQAYYPLKGTKVVNCWTALDPIPVETALRFWRGSHTPGIVYQAANFERPSEDYKHLRHERPPIPDIDHDPNGEILATALAPGDMLIWNSHTFHSAPGNELDRRRAAFSVNWVGDDVTYEDVPAIATYRDAGLNTSDRIDCDKFPLVRSV